MTGSTEFYLKNCCFGEDDFSAYIEGTQKLLSCSMHNGTMRLEINLSKFDSKTLKPRITNNACVSQHSTLNESLGKSPSTEKGIDILRTNHGLSKGPQSSLTLWIHSLSMPNISSTHSFSLSQYSSPQSFGNS